MVLLHFDLELKIAQEEYWNWYLLLILVKRWDVNPLEEQPELCSQLKSPVTDPVVGSPGFSRYELKFAKSLFREISIKTPPFFPSSLLH